MTYGFGTMQFSEGNLDAFSRLRISDSNTQFESKFTYGNEERLYNTTVASGGAATYLPNEAAWNLTITGASGSKCLRESYRYMQYHPGKSQQVLVTGVFGSATALCQKRMGYYDDNDGLFWLQDGANGMAVVERSSTSGAAVDNVIRQANWNVDKLDGTGPSGVTLDVTKTNIFIIDFQWLGVGGVRFGVDIDGQIVLVHKSYHANNTYTQVYMKSAWLPIRYELINLGAGTANSLKQICAAVISEGGMEEMGTPYSAADFSNLTATTGTWTPVVSIQVGTTLNGQKFRGKINITTFETLVTSTNAAAVALFENPTLTGASFASVHASSAVLADTAASAVTGGSLRYTGFSARTSAAAIKGTSEMTLYAGYTYCLAMRGIGGSATVSGAINWNEVV